MQDVNITLSTGEIKEIVKTSIAESVLKVLSANKGEIESQLNAYFKKPMFDKKDSLFESNLDWAVELAFREGLTQAMEELNFKELIAQRAKEVLSDNNFIQQLAEAKVRASLGLPTV